MLTDQFRYFSLVYEARNFSLAARRVPMSVQGITKAIRSIERELGVKLFAVEENGELVPTSYADELVEFVDKYAYNRIMLEESFNRIKAEERHEIRIGFCVGILGHLGPDFFFGFHEQYPDLTLSYNEYNDESCDQGLRQGSYDIALTLYPYEADFITTELFETRMEYWVNVNNPLSNKEILRVEDFQNSTIAIPGRSYKCFKSLMELCEPKDIAFKRVYEITEIFRIFEFALSNHGLGYTTHSLSRLGVFSDNSTIVALPFEEETWRFGLSHLSTHELTEPEKRFFEYCAEYTRKMEN